MKTAIRYRVALKENCWIILLNRLEKMMTYREIEVVDLPAIFDLRIKTWHNPNGAEELERMGITLDTVREMMSKTHRGWLAENEGDVVGFTMGNGQTGEMWVIAVLQEFENRGIGKSLMSLVEDWLISEGCEELWLTTDPDESYRAVGFYKHLGWRDWKLEDGDRFMRKKRVIEVVPYDPNWVELFEQESARIREVITEGLVNVHHIGSTSVPGLAAKPTIDLMPEVSSLVVLDQFDQAMESLGYQVKGEFGIPGRRFYLKGLIERTHHVHAFESGSDGLLRHLAVRDYLRSHPAEAAAYADLKIKLAAQFPHDNDGYCDGKHEFVQQLERRALRS